MSRSNNLLKLNHFSGLRLSRDCDRDKNSPCEALERSPVDSFKTLLSRLIKFSLGSIRRDRIVSSLTVLAMSAARDLASVAILEGQARYYRARQRTLNSTRGNSSTSRCSSSGCLVRTFTAWPVDTIKCRATVCRALRAYSSSDTTGWGRSTTFPPTWIALSDALGEVSETPRPLFENAPYSRFSFRFEAPRTRRIQYWRCEGDPWEQ